MHPIVKLSQPGGTPLHVAIVDPLVVGRECDGLLLSDEKVSRQHFRLHRQGTAVVITDLGSTNGCFLDGVRIDGEAVLATGATLMVGDTIVTLETPPPAPPGVTSTSGGTLVARIDPKQTLGHAPATPEPASGQPVVRPASHVPDAMRSTGMDKVVASLGPEFALPSGSADDTVTIMFSDIESSTELALAAGDHRWYEILTWHNQLIEERVAAHGGFIVKNQGDGFMVTFNSARRAIICAGQIQQALRQNEAANPSSPIRVRIGMHTGEAIRHDSGDLFGRHVIIAARVGALAAGGEVLVSSIVREIASARGDLHFGEGNEVELKGVGLQTVSQVLWSTDLPTS